MMNSKSQFPRENGQGVLGQLGIFLFCFVSFEDLYIRHVVNIQLRHIKLQI
jgi:hypothetical protein